MKKEITVFGCKISIVTILPLRALIGLVVHGALALLALTPGLSNYFNKLNGDVERWVNGHTDEDLKTKSAGRRNYEVPYLALCEQPLFQVAEPSQNCVNDMGEGTKKVALRVFFTGNFTSRVDVIEVGMV